jgi:hypothetical protein
MALALCGCSSCDPQAFEKAQTEKLLGVPVEDFRGPQGPDRFDDLPAQAKPFRFQVTQRALSGPAPTPLFERPRVLARGPDGQEYEAYCARPGSAALRQELAPGRAPDSSGEHVRHCYDGSGHWRFHPKDVFIGKRTPGGLEPALVFPDVGSHDMDAHAMAVDRTGACHLVVADVEIFQSNRFHLYWVVGDMATGKWTRAWLVDRRGFTQSAAPWCAAWGDTVQLLLAWDTFTERQPTGRSGVYHLEWRPSGFGPKVQVLHGNVTDEANNWGAALDAATGRLLLVASRDDGIVVAARPAGGEWSRPTRLADTWRGSPNLFVEAPGDGTFTIRAAWDGAAKEYVIKPLP